VDRDACVIGTPLDIPLLEILGRLTTGECFRPAGFDLIDSWWQFLLLIPASCLIVRHMHPSLVLEALQQL